MIVKITLSTPLGANLGPFTLTANTGTVSPNTATRQQLLDGLDVTASDTASIITVTSTGDCTNSIGINITGIPTPPPPPPPPPPSGICYLYQFTASETDINDATGNNDPTKNNTVSFRYMPCDGVVTTQEISEPGGVENICVDSNSLISITYLKNDVERAATTSTAINTEVVC